MSRSPVPLPNARVSRRLLVLGGICAFGAAACTSGTDAVDQTAGGEYRFVGINQSGQLIAAGKRKTIPDFSGTTLDGTTVSIAAYRGKVVLVNFWASWCPPCRSEAPDIEALFRREQARGLQVLGVDFKEDSKAKPRAFVARHGLTYPSIWDPDSEIAVRLHNFPTNSPPSTLLVDRSGKVAGAYIGPQQPGDLSRAVTPLLAEQAR